METGRLEDEPTSVVCRRLGAESRTGCLHLPGRPGVAGTEVVVHLRDGRISTAAAPGQRARLGDRLVGGGHISSEALERALDAQRVRSPDIRIGDLLVEQGLVSRAMLKDVVREQICDSLAVAVSILEGEWRFVDGEEKAEDQPLGLGVEDALLEAARRLREIGVILAQLGSLDAVVDFRARSTDVRISLLADEWEMLNHIDGSRTVREIAASSGYTELEVARIIYGLLSAGVLKRVGDPPQGLAARLAIRGAGGLGSDTGPQPIRGGAVPPPPPAGPPDDRTP